MNVQVRRFRESEWQAYKSLRLASLEESPDAFGSTLSHAVAIPDLEWQKRLQDIDEGKDLPLVALVDDAPVGLAWGRVDDSDPRRVHLYQMWVDPEVRYLGVGRQLLDEFISWAKPRYDRAVLGVTCGNAAAERLYRSAGFVPIGDTEPLREGSRLRTQTMERELR